MLLHAVVIALLLLTRAQEAMNEDQSPPSVSVVFENGGGAQTTAPPTPLKGPPVPAQAPAVSPPPPPPPSAQAQASPPVPEAPVRAQMPPQHTAAQPRATPHYAMMLNGMSFGNPSPLMPAPPQTHRALNIDLPTSDADAANAPELQIKGNVGADWKAALDQWVEAHKYYPQAALEQGQQGNVEIEFTVDRQGNVTGLHMLNGSGSVFLDQAWLGLFQGAQLPAFPTGTKDDHVTIDATMHYILQQ